MKKFLKDRRGSVSTIFAVATVPLVVATGFAVDNARMAQQETELQNALDAAVTAAASFVGSPADFRIEVAETYMAANFDREFADGPNFVVDGNKVSGSARLAVPLVFMPIINIDYGKVVGAASAEGVPGATICMLALGPNAEEGVRLIGTTALE
ncbi:MAG: TadE/TadG family type IV pilus assembly protein, partial [Alphaproteobacteria bacterium]